MDVIGSLKRFWYGIQKLNALGIALGLFLVGYGWFGTLNSFATGVEVDAFRKLMMGVGIIALIPSILTLDSFRKSTRNRARHIRSASGVAIMGYAAAIFMLGLTLVIGDPNFPSIMGLQNPTGLFLFIVAIEVLLLAGFLKVKNNYRVEFNLMAFFIFALVADTLAAIILSGNFGGFGIAGEVLGQVAGGQPAYGLEVIPTIIYLVMLKIPVVAFLIFLGANVGRGGSSPAKAVKDAGNYIFVMFLILISLTAVAMPAYLVYSQSQSNFTASVGVDNPAIGDFLGKMNQTTGPTGEFVVKIMESILPSDWGNFSINFDIQEVLGYSIWQGVLGFPTEINGERIPYGQVTMASLFYVIMFFLALRSSSEERVMKDVDKTLVNHLSKKEAKEALEGEEE